MSWGKQPIDFQFDNTPMWLNGDTIRFCEYCGRPNKGPDRCPHAIDPKYPCPHHSDGFQARMRHIGV